MNYILWIVLLFPLSVFADTTLTPYSIDQCNTMSDPEEKSECLDDIKDNEAQQNFNNFEENNESAYQQEF